MSVAMLPKAKAVRNGMFETKKERFNWSPLGPMGVLMMLDKFLLNVDHQYQRPDKQSRILRIAKSFSWQSCLVIAVSRRSDGTYWVFDGQHRVLAARKRDDIQELPCLVFEGTSITQEAKAFDDVNNMRGSMRSLERFKARLVAHDPVALEVAGLVEGIDYQIAAGEGQHTLACVQAIETIVVRDRETAETVLMLGAEIYDGRTIRNQVLLGLAYVHQLLKKQNERITRPDIRRKLLAAGRVEIERAIASALAYHGKGGERVYADGIIRLINKGKRSNQLPPAIK